MSKRFERGDLVTLHPRKNRRRGLEWLAGKGHSGLCLFRITEVRRTANWRVIYACVRVCCEDDPKNWYWTAIGVRGGAKEARHGHSFPATWLRPAEEKDKERLALLAVLKDVKEG